MKQLTLEQYEGIHKLLLMACDMYHAQYMSDENKKLYPITKTSGRFYYDRIGEVFVKTYKSYFADEKKAYDFYDVFYHFVNEVYDDKVFYSGIGRAYFNIIKQLNYDWMEMVSDVVLNKSWRETGLWSGDDNPENLKEYNSTLGMELIRAIVEEEN